MISKCATQRRHTNARPYVVQRWSTTTKTWVHVSDEKNRAAAERYIALRTAVHIFDKYRIVEQDAV